MQAKIDRFGRIVIPKTMREHFDLAPGSSVELEEHANNIKLTPLRDRSILKREGKLLVHTGRLASDIDKVINDIRQERLSKLSGLE